MKKSSLFFTLLFFVACPAQHISAQNVKEVITANTWATAWVGFKNFLSTNVLASKPAMWVADNPYKSAFGATLVAVGAFCSYKLYTVYSAYSRRQKKSDNMKKIDVAMIAGNHAASPRGAEFSSITPHEDSGGHEVAVAPEAPASAPAETSHNVENPPEPRWHLALQQRESLQNSTVVQVQADGHDEENIFVEERQAQTQNVPLPDPDSSDKAIVNTQHQSRSIVMDGIGAALQEAFAGTELAQIISTPIKNEENHQKLLEKTSQVKLKKPSKAKKELQRKRQLIEFNLMAAKLKKNFDQGNGTNCTEQKRVTVNPLTVEDFNKKIQVLKQGESLCCHMDKIGLGFLIEEFQKKKTTYTVKISTFGQDDKFHNVNIFPTQQFQFERILQNCGCPRGKVYKVVPYRTEHVMPSGDMVEIDCDPSHVIHECLPVKFYKAKPGDQLLQAKSGTKAKRK